MTRVPIPTACSRLTGGRSLEACNNRPLQLQLQLQLEQNISHSPRLRVTSFYPERIQGKTQLAILVDLALFHLRDFAELPNYSLHYLCNFRQLFTWTYTRSYDNKLRFN